MTLLPGTQLGRYEIRSKIGQGGMGEVYRGLDTQLDREVAIKILPAELAANEERLRRFVQEAKTAASLHHPNITQVFEIGHEGTTHFIAMEYVVGETLRQLLSSRKLEVKRSIDLAAQVASGLAAAHKVGIVHRDIKPENLLINGAGQVKILDFGLAKLVDRQRDDARNELSTVQMASGRNETVPGVIMGTVSYMSPEQARAERVDQRTDIFSLGVVLYEMVAGERPFKAKSAIDTLHAIINVDPEPATKLNPLLPPEFGEILEKALAKDLPERYQHAGDFEIDLRRFKRALETNTLISVQTKAIRKSSSSSRTWKWAVVVMLLAIVAVTAGWWIGKSGRTSLTGVSLGNVTLVPLTSDPGYESEPSFSPNGETIAYVSDRTGDFEIYIQQATGGGYRNITENKGNDVQPAYSPNGQQIAFVSTRSSPSSLRYEGYDLPFMGGDVWVMPALGGNAMRVAENGNFPSWSRDGLSIIYTAGPAYAQKIYRVNARGGNAREIVPKINPSPRFLLYPAYSADEQWIVFESDPPTGFGLRDIWVMNTRNGDAQYIAKGQHPIWNADSTAIIYSSADPGKNYSLWQVPFSTVEGKVSGVTQPLTVGRGRDAHPTISADGKLIAFAGVETTFNVETLMFDSEAGRVAGTPQQLTIGRRVSYFQSFSPNGKSVVFESRQGSATRIWRIDHGGVPIQLTSDPNIDDSYPRWSPVDHTIAFNRKPLNEPLTANNIWLVTDDGANPRLLIEKAGNFAWMPDGRALVYFSPTDSQLHLFELSTRNDRVLTNEQKIVQIIATAPDGKWVIFQTLKNGNIDLRAVSIDGGDSRAVVETPHQDYHPFVSPSGRWLYFQMDHKNLWRVPGPALNWERAEPEKMTTFPESGLFLEDPQISRDGRQLLYSRGRITGDIWIMNLGK